MIKCPYCWEEIKELAKKCKWCWEWLNKDSNFDSISKKWLKQNIDNKVIKRNIFLFIGIIIIVLIGYYGYIYYWKLIKTTYPWCNTQDITINSKDWNQVWSACNIWTSISWLWKESYWNYFSWWMDAYETILEKINENSKDTKDINAWWDITNTAESRKWPCASWYHVPSKIEWEYAILIITWNKDLSNNINYATKFQDTLKLPFAWRFWWLFTWKSWEYWSSTPDNYSDWNGKYSFALGLTKENDMLQTNAINWLIRRENISVRCIRN